MNMKFDFVMHWLYAIVWAVLGISGFAMVGAKYGWILDFNYGTADYVHRLGAVAFVILTFVSIVYEIVKKAKGNEKPLVWHIIGRSGYQLFIFITTLLIIISGALIWVCIEFQMTGIAFAMLIHEYVAYLMLGSIIWHIYMKCHALIWPKKAVKK
jgi:cytochrome b subunit of formate dehydrogenase